MSSCDVSTVPCLCETFWVGLSLQLVLRCTCAWRPIASNVAREMRTTKPLTESWLALWESFKSARKPYSESWTNVKMSTNTTDRKEPQRKNSCEDFSIWCPTCLMEILCRVLGGMTVIISSSDSLPICYSNIGRTASRISPWVCNLDAQVYNLWLSACTHCGKVFCEVFS